MRSFQRLVDSVKYFLNDKSTPAGKEFGLCNVNQVEHCDDPEQDMGQSNRNAEKVESSVNSSLHRLQPIMISAICLFSFGFTSTLASAEQSQVVENASPASQSGVDGNPQLKQANPVLTKLVRDYDFTQSLYSLVLSQKLSQSLSKDSPLNSQMISQSNQNLLLRLTGRPSYEITEEGRQFIAQNKKWLKSFDWVPVMQEGVSVGEQLRLNYDPSAVNAAFEMNNIKVWPSVLRPSILVMGTYVQNGSLIKLNQSQVESQAVAPLLEKSKQMGLKLAIPESIDDWVFPVEPEQSLNKIQEWLLASEKDYLLSYKISTRNINSNLNAHRMPSENQQYELSWRVFTSSGKEIIKGRAFGDNQAVLIEKMLPMVTARLVDFTETKLQKKAQLYLNLLEVTDAEVLIHAREYLNQELPTIEKLQLSELEGELAQFTLNLKGSYQDFLGWIMQNPSFNVVNESEILRQIDVVYSMPVEVDESQLEALLESGMSEQAKDTTENTQTQNSQIAPVGATIMQDNRREVVQ